MALKSTTVDDATYRRLVRALGDRAAAVDLVGVLNTVGGGTLATRTVQKIRKAFRRGAADFVSAVQTGTTPYGIQTWRYVRNALGGRDFADAIADQIDNETPA